MPRNFLDDFADNEAGRSARASLVEQATDIYLDGFATGIASLLVANGYSHVAATAHARAGTRAVMNDPAHRFEIGQAIDLRLSGSSDLPAPYYVPPSPTVQD